MRAMRDTSSGVETLLIVADQKGSACGGVLRKARDRAARLPM